MRTNQNGTGDVHKASENSGGNSANASPGNNNSEHNNSERNNSGHNETGTSEVITEAECESSPEESITCYLVRVGTMGHIGRFRPLDGLSVARNQRVICRTTRGLEVGRVLAPATPPTDGTADKPTDKLITDWSDGRLIRKMTPEDELLWANLERLSNAAHRQCQQWLNDQALAATLIDVEPLMDGKTLYFHFLSDAKPEIQEQIQRLSDIYEAEVRSSQFASLLEHGCGPGCGTEESQNGCGSSGGCAVCKVATACKTAR